MLRNLKQTLLAVLVLAPLAAAFVRGGETQVFDPDALLHTPILLPDGATVTVITYNDVKWRMVGTEILKGPFKANEDVCFEAKFDIFEAPNKLKLLGVGLPAGKEAVVLIDERSRKAVSQMNNNDNLWICGSTFAGPDGVSVVVRVSYVHKLLGDIPRFENRINVLQREGLADNLLEIAGRIEQLKGVNITFADSEKLSALRNKAIDAGLNLKERNVKQGDNNQLFDLARKWKDLRKNHRRHRELVLRILETDPEHSQASKVALEDFDMIKFEGRWITRSEHEDILAARKKQQQQEDAAQVAARDLKQKQRIEAVEKRHALILLAQSNLRTGDSQGRALAVEKIGKDAQQSLDSGFGEESVDLLANLPDAGALAGLESAGKSEHPQVRQRVLEALLFKAQQDEQALSAFGRTMRSEKDAGVGRNAVDAAVAMGGRKGASALIDSLSVEDAEVRKAVIEGLKQVTKQQQIGSPAEFQEWFNKHKDSLN